MAGVVVEFPDVEAARSWYYSEDYQRAVAIRAAASESYAFILDSWPFHMSH